MLRSFFNIGKPVFDGFTSCTSACQQWVRHYSVPKRKLIRKAYFVYKPQMKSRYKGNPNPRVKMILSEDVDKLGVKGSLVDAKRGYIHHHLLPNQLAVYATQENLEKHGLSLSETSTTSKVPINVLNYLKKHEIKLLTPDLNEIHEKSRDQWVITRHDIAEYFHRQSGLQVPVHCMNIKDNLNNEIRRIGDYVVEITLNKIVTVPVPLAVVQRPDEEEETE